MRGRVKSLRRLERRLERLEDKIAKKIDKIEMQLKPEALRTLAEDLILQLDDFCARWCPEDPCYTTCPLLEIREQINKLKRKAEKLIKLYNKQFDISSRLIKVSYRLISRRKEDDCDIIGEVLDEGEEK